MNALLTGVALLVAATAAADPPQVPGPNGWNINVVDAVEVGTPFPIHIDGPTAFVGYPGMLSVLDITTPTSPVRIGFALLAGPCSNMARNGDILYCSVGGGYLQIVDVSILDAPVVIATLAVGGSSLDVDGNHLFIEHGNGVRVYDVTDPTNPALVAYFTSTNPRDLVARNGYVYVATNSHLQIVDASDPTNPVQVAMFFVGGGPLAIDIEGSHVYAICDSPNFGFHVIDVSTPSLPTEVSHVFMPGLRHFAVENDYAYLVDDRNHLLRILDITDPANPIEQPPFPPCNARYLLRTDVSGSIAGVTSQQNGICFVDVSNPDSTSSLVFQKALDPVNSVAVAGGHIALSVDYGDLVTLNRYDSALRYFSGLYDPDIDNSRVVVRGDYAYVAMCASWELAGGLHIFDIADPKHPAMVGQLSSPCAYVVCAGENYIYFAHYYEVWTVDVSDPTFPQKVGELPLLVTDLFAKEPYLFAAAEHSLAAIDVSNPTAPSVVSSLPLGGYLWGLWIVAAPTGQVSYAYVTAGTNVWIVDISDPHYLSLVGNIPATSATSIRVRDRYGYLSDANHLRIFDLSNATNPVEVGNIETATLSGVGGIAVAPPYIYAVTTGPLLTLETPLITNVPNTPRASISLKQNYPNPFNPSTRIVFDIPSREYTRLEIFDVRGRLVRALVDETLSAGAHSVDWDGRDWMRRDAPSGVYFYRLRAAGKTETKKMILLK
jgi:hypothetical protein